nr:unnamed protein product [Digitaria exilis]
MGAEVGRCAWEAVYSASAPSTSEEAKLARTSHAVAVAKYSHRLAIYRSATPNLASPPMRFDT